MFRKRKLQYWVSFTCFQMKCSTARQQVTARQQPKWQRFYFSFLSDYTSDLCFVSVLVTTGGKRQNLHPTGLPDGTGGPAPPVSHWHPVNFINESRLKLSPCDRPWSVWRYHVVTTSSLHHPAWHVWCWVCAAGLGRCILGGSHRAGGASQW